MPDSYVALVAHAARGHPESYLFLRGALDDIDVEYVR